MAVQAIVDKQFSAVLQSPQIIDFVGRFVPRNSVCGGKSRPTGEHADQQAENDFFHGCLLQPFLNVQQS
jgi:hypothetical protein